MSPVEIIDEYFENERVKTLLLYAACMWGLDPNDTGLGFLVPLYIDRAMNKAVCYGGSHKFAGSLSRVIHGDGGVVLDNAEVTKILVSDGRVTGVEIFDGRVVHAKAVLSSLPPPFTFGQLMDRQHVPGELASVAYSWEWEHWSFFTVAVATEDQPMYTSDDPWVNDAFMTVMGYDSTDELLTQWQAVRGGSLGDRAGGHATVETRYDPTLPRVPGHHVAFLQTHVPGDIDGGWKAHHDEVIDRQMELWRRHVPGLTPDKLLRHNGESPLDIETRLPHMVHGSIKHGDYNSLQMGVFRPHESCIAGRTPIDGLYLCGASSYPGGLVIGGPGYIAATSVVEDLGANQWWALPRWVEQYRDTYLTDLD
jgi:phytoene dehydrogenase-like protein